MHRYWNKNEFFLVENWCVTNCRTNKDAISAELFFGEPMHPTLYTSPVCKIWRRRREKKMKHWQEYKCAESVAAAIQRKKDREWQSKKKYCVAKTRNKGQQTGWRIFYLLFNMTSAWWTIYININRYKFICKCCNNTCKSKTAKEPWPWLLLLVWTEQCTNGHTLTGSKMVSLWW